MSALSLRKGALVKFRMTSRWVQGIIKDDLGPIGVRGRHLYLVEFHLEPESVSLIELPAEDLQPVPNVLATD